MFQQRSDVPSKMSRILMVSSPPEPPLSMESDPILSPDASGAPVPTDRWAVAASKRRLVACLASVSLLACFSTTMLLRWPHEMKTAFEAKADLVLLPDSNTTAALDSSASGTLDSSTHEAWTTIR